MKERTIDAVVSFTLGFVCGVLAVVILLAVKA